MGKNSGKGKELSKRGEVAYVCTEGCIRRCSEARKMKKPQGEKLQREENSSRERSRRKREEKKKHSVITE